MSIDRPNRKQKNTARSVFCADADSITNFQTLSIPQLKSIRFGYPGILDRCEDDPFGRARQGLLILAAVCRGG